MLPSVTVLLRPELMVGVAVDAPKAELSSLPVTVLKNVPVPTVDGPPVEELEGKGKGGRLASPVMLEKLALTVTLGGRNVSVQLAVVVGGSIDALDVLLYPVGRIDEALPVPLILDAVRFVGKGGGMTDGHGMSPPDGLDVIHVTDMVPETDVGKVKVVREGSVRVMTWESQLDVPVPFEG